MSKSINWRETFCHEYCYLRVLQAGVVESMNELAREFMATSEDREDIISQAQTVVEAEEDARWIGRGEGVCTTPGGGVCTTSGRGVCTTPGRDGGVCVCTTPGGGRVGVCAPPLVGIGWRCTPHLVGGGGGMCTAVMMLDM